ncbi:MAG: uracil-DNA glycosylase [Planctomycetota bacterium]|nr:uracil-DNA glycosylase [Planctomycetota bacterium]
MTRYQPPTKDVLQFLRSLKDAGVTEIPRVHVELSEAWRRTSAESADAKSDSRSSAPPNAAGSEGQGVGEASKPRTSGSVAAKQVMEDSQAKAALDSTAPGLAPAEIDGAYPARSQSENLDRALAILSEEVSQCQACSELSKIRTQTVFGVGDPRARVVFFGEAPGADEDRIGEPFVGKAGQLLDRILSASTFRRDEVYILNTLKCRPPGNRNPNDVEIQNCGRFWQRQLELIQPEYVVCLGAIAVRTLLQTDRSIARLRGDFHRYRGSKVLVTYHPAYLLRNESAKRLVWEDMKLLLSDMGIEVPKSSA